MLRELKAFLEGRSVVPVAPQAFVPIVPETDDEPEIEDFSPDLEGVAGVGCILTYVDSRGTTSFRRVTCRKLSERCGTRYVQAFCHERQALRTFRVDRVTEVACGVTGEVFIPATLFFDRFLALSGGGAAVGFGLNVGLAADLRAGLNVLAFLAKVDGKVVRAEREVMSRYCQSFAVRFAGDDFDFDGVCSHACRLAPDAETFFVSIQRLKREDAPEGLAALTRRAAGELIEADGVQDPKEFFYGLKLQEALS